MTFSRHILRHIVQMPMNSAFRAVSFCLLTAIISMVETRAADAEESLDESLILHIGNGDAAKVTQLLDQGANPNAAIARGMTALHYAAEQREVEIMLELIARGAEVNRQDNYGRTPLVAAAKSGPAVKVLLKAGAEPSELALAVAAAEGARDAVDLLLEAGVRPDAGIVSAAGRGSLDLLQFFLAKGADVNATTENGVTPLHAAASPRQLEMAKFLIARGADLNARDNGGKTPLHRAAGEEGGTEIVRLLIDAGARVNLPDNEGITPIRRAALEGERASYELLLKANRRIETTAPGFVDEGLRPTAELITDLTSKDHAARKAALAPLVARGEKIMPEVLKSIEAGADIALFLDLFAKMGPSADAALPKLETALSNPERVFVVLRAMHQMKPGHFESLPRTKRDAAAAALFKIIEVPGTDEMIAGMLVEVSPSLLGEASAPHLLRLLRSDDADDRYNAADALSHAQFKNEELRSRLVQLALEDPNTKVRSEAAGALSNPHFHSPEAKAAIIEILREKPIPIESLPSDSNSPEHRRAYIERTSFNRLVSNATGALASYGPKIVEELLPLVRTDSDPDWKQFRKAWSYLGPSAVPHFVKLLDQSDFRIRQIAFQELGRLASDSPQAIEILLERIESDELITKQLAGRALLSVNRRAGKAVLPALLKLTADSAIPIEIRLSAVKAALTIDEAHTKGSEHVRRFLPEIIAVAAQHPGYAQLQAIETLGALGRTAAPALDRLEALTKMEMPTLPPRTKPLVVKNGKIHDPDLNLRRAYQKQSRVGHIRNSASRARDLIEKDIRRAKL